jgi:hypothetical protein
MPIVEDGPKPRIEEGWFHWDQPLTSVRPEWVDGYKHMNMGNYLVAYDLQTDRLWEHIALGRPLRAAGLGTFAAEAWLDYTMKKIGFLSFGHWTPSPQSQTRSAADALLQSIDLAVAAEELGADGAYFRVRTISPASSPRPFPLLAAVGAKTSRIEIGTAVIDMRYENPLYMAEDAGAADLIAGGRCSSASAAARPSR